EQRWQTARDLLAELEWISSCAVEFASAGSRAKTAAIGRALPWALVAGAAILIMLAAIVHQQTATGVAPAVRFAVAPPSAAGFASAPVISPDGRLLTFVAAAGGRAPELWIRRLDQMSARPIPGSEEALFPFWSPDSHWIAFFAKGKLKKV